MSRPLFTAVHPTDPRPSDAAGRTSVTLSRRPARSALLAGVIAIVWALGTVTPASAAPSLSVDPISGLQDGATVQVSGSGYDTSKGIYVAYCVVPSGGGLPTPCGGGADTTGSTGASVWISDDPPPYGEGLARPFDAGGSFRTSLSVTATIAGHDCRQVTCAVVTRADHTRTTDRSADVIVPISFAAPGGAAPRPDTSVNEAPSAPEPAPQGPQTSTLVEPPQPEPEPGPEPAPDPEPEAEPEPTDEPDAEPEPELEPEPAPEPSDGTIDEGPERSPFPDAIAPPGGDDGAPSTLRSRDTEDAAEVEDPEPTTQLAAAPTGTPSPGPWSLFVASAAVAAIAIGVFVRRRRRAAVRP